MLLVPFAVPRGGNGQAPTGARPATTGQAEMLWHAQARPAVAVRRRVGGESGPPNQTGAPGQPRALRVCAFPLCLFFWLAAQMKRCRQCSNEETRRIPERP